MKEQDLLKAIRDLPDETVEKYALPKAGKPDALPNETAAGKEHIMINDTVTEKKKPIRIHRTGIAAAVVICLGLNAGLIYGISKMRSGDTTLPGYSPAESSTSENIQTMPDLIGMDYDGSKMMYGDVIQIVVESREYSSFEAGFIFDQDIPPGEPIQKGDTVHVKVSIGTKRVELPDVTGWDFETAKTQILGLGLYVDKRSSYDDEVPEGKVISTDPEAPAEFEPGSYVRVMVSLGPNKDTVIVPNVAGMAFDDAKQVLESMGLSVVRQDTVSEERADNVISMNVAAGEEVAEGTAITLNVSTGVSRPGMKTVRITFNIPEDAIGSYHIILNDSGVAAAVSSSFDPQIAAGVAALTVEGTQEADLTAVLVNDTTGAEATIGVYHVDFEAGTSEMVSGSISEAFSAVANET